MSADLRRRPAKPDVSDLTLRLIAAAGISTGVIALLLDVYGVIGMPFTISFIAVPATIAVVATAAKRRRLNRNDLMRRLWVGMVTGLIATAVYDLGRALVFVATPADFNPFRAIPNFGTLMLGVSNEATAAMVGGWGYHVWNGISFAILYTLLAGQAKARWAIGWAVVLETATIIVTPRYAGISPTDVAFISVSLTGHLPYGATLGVLARSWLSRDSAGTYRLGTIAFAGDVW